MVLTSCPSAMTASVVQDLTALPSTCTTQAPHCDVSQPTWVPVSRKCSRRNCTSSVRGSTSPVTDLPFTVIATADIKYLLEIRARSVAVLNHALWPPTQYRGSLGPIRAGFHPF